MKVKKIRRSIFAILMVAVLMVGTSVIGVGAATQKTYLDTLLYSDFSTNTEEQGVNYMTKFDGSVYVSAIEKNYKCSNALYFNFSASTDNYTDEQKKFGPYMEVSYDIKNSNYRNFVSKLLCKNISRYCNVQVYGDGQCLFRQSINGDSNIIDINLDVSKVSTFTIKLTQPVYSIYGHSDVYFDNAYFTSNGSTPEPTERPTQETTQKPTQTPTKPVVTTSVAPTTAKPDINPTIDVEDTTSVTKATSSTEKTTAKVYPTASTNATSKISTLDTAGTVNNNANGNGAIQTGAVSVTVIVLMLLASLGTGAFAWYKRKVK